MDKNYQIKKVWEIAKKILENSLRDKPYQKYIEPQPLENKSINCIMYRMLSHALNTPRKRNAIKLDENKEQYEKILKQFNPKEISKMSSMDIKNLLNDNISFYPKGSWGDEYIRVIKEVSDFLTPFEDANDFIRFCQLINKKLNKKYLPKMLQDIHWYGPALSRDLLKELGFDCYAKPDVHVKEFISEIFHCKNDDYTVLKIINKISEVAKEKSYLIDKIIYLPCTHDFYLNGDEQYKDNKSKTKNNKRKQELIKQIKEKCENIGME